MKRGQKSHKICFPFHWKHNDGDGCPRQKTLIQCHTNSEEKLHQEKGCHIEKMCFPFCQRAKKIRSFYHNHVNAMQYKFNEKFTDAISSVLRNAVRRLSIASIRISFVV